MDPRQAHVLRMQRAAAAAARVLGELWPKGCASLIEHDAHPMGFAVEMECDGVTVRRIADLRDSLLYDEIRLGDRRPNLLLRGARQLEPGTETLPGTVAVDVPKDHWWQRRPRPQYWTEGEVERLCRRLNEIDAYVIGTVETRCRVCGYADGEARWVGQEPRHGVCHCCGAESGVHDASTQDVALARASWISTGRPWSRPEDQPGDWDSDTALAALPPTWRDL